MAGKYTLYSNHIISIQDVSATDIFDPTKYNDIKRAIFDLFGDEDVFMSYKNACLTDTDSWKLFVKAGKLLLKQIDDDGIANQLKTKCLPVLFLDANYYAEEYKKVYRKYNSRKKTTQDATDFNEALKQQVREMGESMATIVNNNNKTAYNNGILKEPEIEISKK